MSQRRDKWSVKSEMGVSACVCFNWKADSRDADRKQNERERGARRATKVQLWTLQLCVIHFSHLANRNGPIKCVNCV